MGPIGNICDSICSSNSLVLAWWQVVNCTNVDPIHWSIYTSQVSEWLNLTAFVEQQTVRPMYYTLQVLNKLQNIGSFMQAIRSGDYA